MDAVDKANDHTNSENEYLISAVRREAAISKYPITGYCHYCGGKSPKKAFCDVHCRDDQEREEILLKRSGR